MKEKPATYGEKYIQYKKELLKAGVHLLENDSVLLDWAGSKVRISSLEIPLRYYGKFTKKKN